MIPDKASPGNEDLERSLLELPDDVALAKRKWSEASLHRKEIEAEWFLHFKGSLEKATVKEIECRAQLEKEVHDSSMEELIAESEYIRLYEKLLSDKTIAKLRTAF